MYHNIFVRHELDWLSLHFGFQFLNFCHMACGDFYLEFGGQLVQQFVEYFLYLFYTTYTY